MPPDKPPPAACGASPAASASRAGTNPAPLEDILVACDALNDAQHERIAAAAAGWAAVRRISHLAAPAEFQHELPGATIVVGWAPARLLAGSSVRLYLCGSAGLDAYLGVGLDTKPGFRICSAGGTMSVPIAEHLLTLMLALTRQLPAILRQQAERRWERRHLSGELANTTVCIVGLGGSGTELARRCRALGLRVIGVRRDAKRAHPYADVIYPIARLRDAVREADHVVAVVPGGPHTRHLFNGAVFDAMKPGARFYTASRGSVVDEDALIAHLRSGQVGGAGLDVFAEEPLLASSPLWDLENVIVSPHSAGLSARWPERICEHFCRNLAHYHCGEPLVDEVNLATYAAALS